MTYVHNIFSVTMIYPFFKGLPLIPTRAAMTELYENNMDLNDALDILEKGYDCSISKRSEEIIEKCINVKRKTMRIVAAKTYNFSLDSEVWAIIHAGFKSKSKVKK